MLALSDANAPTQAGSYWHNIRDEPVSLSLRPMYRGIPGLQPPLLQDRHDRLTCRTISYGHLWLQCWTSVPHTVSRLFAVTDNPRPFPSLFRWPRSLDTGMPSFTAQVFDSPGYRTRASTVGTNSFLRGVLSLLRLSLSLDHGSISE